MRQNFRDGCRPPDKLPVAVVPPPPPSHIIQLSNAQGFHLRPAFGRTSDDVGGKVDKIRDMVKTTLLEFTEKLTINWQ